MNGPYIEVRKSRPYIEVPGLIRWQDGAWSGPALRAIEITWIDHPHGRIAQSPTGPFWGISSPVGALLLLWEAFPWLTLADVETDIEVPPLEYVEGRVYGPLPGPRS